MITLIVIICVLLLLTGGYGYGWGGWGPRYGYGPGYGIGGLLIVIILLWLLFGSARAATGTQDLGTVDALSWYRLVEPYLLSAVQAVVVAAIPIFAAILYKYTGIKLQDSDRQAIQHAAANSAGRIIAGIEGPVSNVRFDLGGKYGSLIASEVERIRATLPTELERREMTPDRVAYMIQAKLGQLQSGTVAAPHN